MNVVHRNPQWQSFLVFLVGIAPLLLGSASFGADQKSTTASQRQPVIKNVGVEEFDRLRKGNNTITLDVRTAEEYAKGHLPGAVNVDWNSRDFAEKVAALDKSRTYLVHCAGGVRSSKACDRMTKLNFTNLYNLEGGLKAWEAAGKPVEKEKAKASSDK